MEGTEDAMFETCEPQALLAYVCVVDTLLLALVLARVLEEWFQPETRAGQPEAGRVATSAVSASGAVRASDCRLRRLSRSEPKWSSEWPEDAEHAEHRVSTSAVRASDCRFRRLSRSEPKLSSAWPRAHHAEHAHHAHPAQPHGASAARMRANAREAPPTPGTPGLPPSCAHWRSEQEARLRLLATI